jgi:hypothetical protein
VRCGVAPEKLLLRAEIFARNFPFTRESGHYQSNCPKGQSGSNLGHHIVSTIADSQEREYDMKNWFLPATVLGLSGMALVFASERGRERVRHFLDELLENGDPLGEFNKFCEEQLETIQQNLDRLAKALEEPHAT